MLPSFSLMLLLAQAFPPNNQAACAAMMQTPYVTITYATLKPATANAPSYCYVQGSISGRIRFHVQLPLRGDWNGRLINIGDGGKDGDLDFADNYVAQGYAVANSNMGHDAGSEPRASFASENPDAVIDFGYRAVHLTANASKAVVRAYYGSAPRYSYFEGCSTGGREGLMEAQRYPDDFDGIVAGAPVFDYQAINVSHVWMAQKIFANNFAGNLAFDKDGDGIPESLTKLNILRDAVIAKCDAKDGIRDGVIDRPLACDFKPEVDLASHMCVADRNGDDCFMRQQIQTIKDIYRGPYDSKGVQIYKGMDFGSEYDWARTLVAHKGNNMFPAKLLYVVDHLNFLFYEKSPGVPPPNPTDIKQKPDKTANPPEFGWWEFQIDDVTAGKGSKMSAITDAKDPNLSRFLIRKGAKLLLYHGWADPEGPAQPTLDYYKKAVETTFRGNLQTAREKFRLFMAPGMGHCGDGPGPNVWDKLAPLANWVEKGTAPNYIVAGHSTNSRQDNERKICAYPQQAVYAGPSGGGNDPANWVEQNFACR
jgi:Tannase and feruloyl esterase